MRVLELFKGTGSVGKVCKELYPDVELHSLDILPKYNPTYCVDIMDFDYKQFPVGHFDIIWASPECKVYSLLQNTQIGRKWNTKEDLEHVRAEHGQYSKKVLEIIDYLKPQKWFIENPYYSAMKDLPHMKDLPSVRFDYCRFGYVYKKPTRIWTNQMFDNVICNCEKRHPMRIGISSKKEMKKTEHVDTTNTNQRYSIPPDLIRHLLTNNSS